MNTKLYIGTEQADFNELFNVVFSIGDIRELSFGNQNKSYTLNLPLTKTNKRLLKCISQADVKSEQSAKGQLYLGESQIITGTVIILEYTEFVAKLIINSDDWMDPLKESKMSTLDLSAQDHVLNNTNVEASWSASYPFFRYPMIDYGGLQSGEFGSTAKWYPSDFVPMISVAQLIAKILEPYTINSAWLATSYIKDLFILGREIIAADDFIIAKGLEVKVTASADNYDSNTGSGPYLASTINKNIEFKTTILDEGSDWSSYTTYTVPVTGTYRFKASVTMYNGAYGNGQITILDEDFVIEIRKNGTAIATWDAGAYSGTELLDGKTGEADTKMVHLASGDTITAHLYAWVYGSLSTSQTITIYTTLATKLKNFWSAANNYAGIGKTISLEEYLPDITKLDFLSAIRDIFNLRFWFDKQKRTIYIEPWDSFLSATVVDLTPYIDYDSIDTEIISKSYSKTITLCWKNDESDQAYIEYLKTNIFGPGRKEISMNSIYTKPVTDYREQPWSSLITGFNQTLGDASTPVPRIWNTLPITPYIIYDRKVGFNTRIIEWKGLTSGFSWNYDGTTKTQYPKIQGIDLVSTYTDYWQKLFHYIDQGKLYTLKIKVNPVLLNQFFTVIVTAASEGFRPTYQAIIAGIKNYFFLQKITSDGQKAELELILKQ